MGGSLGARVTGERKKSRKARSVRGRKRAAGASGGSSAPVYTVQPDADQDGATTVRLTAGHAALAPYVPPTLRRTDTLTVALLVVRVLMAAWAFGLAVVAIRADGDPVAADRAVHGFTLMGAVVGVAWFAVGLGWSVQRTRNTELLEGRFPTMSRAVRVWLYAPVWVVLMTLTLVQLAPQPDFDVRPPIIVGGFVIAMLAPYRLMQRIFRTLVRVQPDAAVFVLYVVDTIAFGVMWWRLVTWPERPIEIEARTIDFLVGSSLAAAIALLIGLLLSAYVDRETDRSEDIRILALRTRHDHRLARLQGLDPMDRATRWALWMARQAADRAADEARLAAEAAAVEGQAPPALPPTLENESLVRALDRRRDEAERTLARATRRRRSQEPGRVPPVVVPAAQAEQLAALAATELEQGDSQRFAIHVRELSRQYPAIDVPVVRGAPRPFDLPAGEAPQMAEEMRAPRLVVVELLRYLTLLVLGFGAAGAGWVLVGASRLSGFDSSIDINRLEQARSVAVLSLVGGNVLSLGWMVASGAYARRVEPSLRTWPHWVLLGAAVPLVVIAAVLEGGAAGPFSLAALLVATVGTLIGVRVFAISNETFGLAEVPVNAWFVDLASAAIFVLISPLGTTLGSSPAGDGLAFGATVVGLTLIVAAVLAAVVMSDFENALRGSVELARPRAARGKRAADPTAT